MAALVLLGTILATKAWVGGVASVVGISVCNVVAGKLAGEESVEPAI